MRDQVRIRSIAFLLTSAFLISILANITHGQTRTRLNAPKELLDVLDKDDRDCVVTNGGLNESVQVQSIQLAVDHGRQILVRGSGLCLCGAQNCAFWIYRKTGNRYELLLQGTGSTKVRAGAHKAKGYRDVLSESHASANETILRTYRYDGAQYQLQSCVNRASYDDNGNYVKRPIDRPCEGEKKSQQYTTLPSSLLDRELTTLDNRHLKLSDYSDKTIVLNLFASWCAACRMALPDLIELKRNYAAHPIEVIGLVSKANDRDVEGVRQFVRNQGINFHVVWDSGDFSNSLVKLLSGPEVLPVTLVIDKAGNVRRSFLGFILTTPPNFFGKHWTKTDAKSR